jgi:hypothetical protein
MVHAEVEEVSEEEANDWMEPARAASKTVTVVATKRRLGRVTLVILEGINTQIRCLREYMPLLGSFCPTSSGFKTRYSTDR